MRSPVDGPMGAPHGLLAVRGRILERRIGRRAFLKVGGLAALAAAAGQLARGVPGTGARPVAATSHTPHRIHLGATDGFTFAPGVVPIPGSPDGRTFLPDPLAEPPLTWWGFGFRDLTSISDPDLRQAQRGKFQAPAPLLWVDQEEDVELTLTNLGMVIRPDLTDGHTVHFHGFRNAIPLFDGVPEMSVAAPINRDLTYFYRPHDPGTYMYHCHFEDTEHVSMGMTGIIFVRPSQNSGDLGLGIPTARSAGGAAGDPLGYGYNDGVPPSDPRSTAYDREYGMFLHEGWAQEHWEGAHILEHDWSEYEPDLWFLNGRSWPDTILPAGGGTDALTGDLIPPAGHPKLQYNPISSLVQANSGDRVLLRFVNLGFQQHAMTIDEFPLRVVGLDATLLRGRDGTDLQTWSNVVYVGPGESVDAIFEAPVVSAETHYRLYNRNLAYLHNPGESGLGGQMTEIHVRPTGFGEFPTQTEPHS